MINTLAHSHGTAMILGWMVFGSTGVLFARYGRVMRFENQRQLYSANQSGFKHIAFFFYERGGWVNINTDGKQLFAHSILGSVVVCCVILQIWLALYRCHPRSRFHFVFDWDHRITGFFAFGFALYNLFLSLL